MVPVRPPGRFACTVVKTLRTLLMTLSRFAPGATSMPM